MLSRTRPIKVSAVPSRFTSAQVKELFERLDPNVEPYQQELENWLADGDPPPIMPTENQVFRWWLDHHVDGPALRLWFDHDRTIFSTDKVWTREMQVGGTIRI